MSQYRYKFKGRTWEAARRRGFNYDQEVTVEAESEVQARKLISIRYQVNFGRMTLVWTDAPKGEDGDPTPVVG